MKSIFRNKNKHYVTSIRPWAIGFLIATILQCLTFVGSQVFVTSMKFTKITNCHCRNISNIFYKESKTRKNGFNFFQKQVRALCQACIYETPEDYYKLHSFKSTKMIISLLFHVVFTFQIFHNKEVRGKRV